MKGAALKRGPHFSGVCPRAGRLAGFAHGRARQRKRAGAELRPHRGKGGLAYWAAAAFALRVPKSQFTNTKNTGTKKMPRSVPEIVPKSVA